MNFITKWLIKGKLGKLLRAEKLTGHRTQVCLGLYLLAVIIEMLGAQLGWSSEVAESMKILKEAAIGAGGLALAAKVTRSGPEAKKK